MTPFIFRRIIYNARIERTQCIQRKKQFQIINRRKFYSFPNGPEEPNYLIMFLTGIIAYYSAGLFNKK